LKIFVLEDMKNMQFWLQWGSFVRKFFEIWFLKMVSRVFFPGIPTFKLDFFVKTLGHIIRRKVIPWRVGLSNQKWKWKKGYKLNIYWRYLCLGSFFYLPPLKQNPYQVSEENFCVSIGATLINETFGDICFDTRHHLA
jgi:hypothetical protein